MRKQTALEHPSKAQERATLALGAFVTSTAADDLAIQAENCIPERDNACIQLPCSGEHMHQPLWLRFGQLRLTRIQRFSIRQLSKSPVPEPTLVPGTISPEGQLAARRLPRCGIVSVKSR